MQPFLTSHETLVASHPMNSSRNFLGLLGLCEVGMLQDSEVRLVLLGRMLSAIRFRDESIFFHARRVTIISMGIAQRLGWSTDETHHLELASLLHDFGKVGVPDHILQKPGRLNADERELIRTSHHVAEILLQACQFSGTTLDIFRDSQTLASDSAGLLGRHLGARILCVADAYDSLTHNQPHRRALTQEQTLQHLQNAESAKFDRNVVHALQRWLATDDSKQLEVADDVEREIRTNSTVNPEAINQASSLCHLFSHLTLLESLYDAYYLLDSQKRIVIWSRGAEAMFDKSRAAVLGKEWSQSLVNYSAKELQESVVQTAIDRHRSFMVTAKVKTQRGDVEAEIQAIPFWDDQHQFRGACEIIHRLNSSRRSSERYQELQLAATRDPLTGLANRAEMETQLTRVTEESKVKGAIPFSVIFLDIDHFKNINDQHSHQVGDQVLVDVAHLIEDELYSGEIIARFGGEEFVVICPETLLEDAYQRAERLRRTIQATSPGGLKVTASFGVAQFEHPDTAETLLCRADAAMFDAKKSGRNKTCQRLFRDKAQGGPSTAVVKEVAEDPYELNGSFKTTVASDLVFHRISGFASANHAKVWDVKPDGCQLSVGETTFFGGWGATESKQPVQITIKIGDIDQTRRTKRVEILVRIIPLGKKPAVEVFQQRASRLRDEVRAYCAAD